MTATAERALPLNTVCDHLRAGLLGAELPSRPRWPAWEALIEVGVTHRVTPALAWCLSDRAFLPDDVSRYFRAALIINEKRNEKLLQSLARVAAALNAIDIEPVLLKGAAHLVEGIYPAAGLRVVGDVDLLVPEQRLKNAADALQQIGFTVGGPVLPEDHHHWPTLFDPETGTPVELHSGALHRRSEHIIPATEFHENARAAAFRGSQVRLPDATRSVGHNIVHDPLDHAGYLHRRMELRQLLDLAMIRKKHESTIDWARLYRHFFAARLDHVLALNLELAEELLGLPVPRVVRRSEYWARVVRVPRLYLEACRRNP
jgi:hypothetical protein